MLEAVMVVACALVAPLLAPTTHAQSEAFIVKDLLGEDLSHLIRSGTPGSTFDLQCTTPDNQQGMCGSATTCPSYLPLLGDLGNTTVVTFFRERVCRKGSGFIHVCCPLQGPTLAPAPVPRPNGSAILFNQPPRLPQPPRVGINRPSQRPNARRPSQGGFSNQSEDEKDVIRDFQNAPSPPIHSPPTTSQPQPPTPRPFLKFTTTTRAPTLVLPQLPPPISTGVMMRPDRGPVVPGSPSVPEPQKDNPPPTEPRVPSILPAEGKCGTTAQGRTGTMPWVVGLGMLDKAEFQVICGGALVSNQHVIAAAHCLDAPTPTHVRLGDMQQQRGTAVDVEVLTWIHPDYNPNTRDNDLALLTLANPVTFTDNIQPVCLPFRYRFDGLRGQQLQVVGWGGGGSVEAGTVQAIGLSECRDAYRSPSLISNNEVAPFSRPSSSSSSSSSSFLLHSPRTTSSVTVDRRHLCGSPAPSASSSSSCLSDHGAPLFFHDEDTTRLHFLAGVSSIGEGCGAGPGLYTRVGAFIPWLAEQLSSVEASVPRPPLNPTRKPTPNTQFDLRRQRG